MTLRDLIAAEARPERRRFRQAAALAALVGAASSLLLGLSGWFITGAALAGLAGPIAAQGFNYLLPSAGIRLLAILRTGSRYGERLTGHAAALRTMARVRGRLFLGSARSPAALALGTGEASSRLVQDVAAIEAGLVRRSTGWGLAASALSGAALICLGGVMALGSTMACLALAIGVCRAIAAGSERPARTSQHEAGLLKQQFAELAGARAELRCYGLEEWAARRMADRSRDFGEAQRRLTARAGLYEAVLGATLALAATGALFLAIPSGAAIAALTALAAAMTIDGAAPFVRDIAARASVRAAEARLDAMLTPASVRLPSHQSTAGPLRLASAGRIALTGPSGCGKTTLVEMLIGQRPLSPGVAALDGRDLAALSVPERRALFAWCPQDAMLLTGTVRDNLRLAAPGAGDEALWSALHDAALDDRVRQLGGLDLWIGEDGIRLSGGERRRLALARALLSPAPILLLDEPTEGLDATTEAQLVRRLDARLGRMRQGLLLVSHRTAPLALCAATLLAA
ncbi:ATP-binding cassette domain-containing protein [Sphingomonas oryzagri]|uniref:ATP-binding cassette domain-containing protein n=1 Tax=Sphingomonas oryzagri TaxID=3042314 RepID=A0ABT6N5P1_9SPHN|nr:ATP-binding cassette domain-containing protein [Sphingomonas oryzagri]MDH7640427.1 ATP-binding cassette domain-containing protein [Sphingomonas oryzagri]